MAAFGSFVAGQVLTAAELNAAGTYSTYTPSFTQSAAITKTTNWARYSQFNDIVIASIKLTASSAGTANNPIVIGLPVNASSNNFVMGTAIFTDTINNYSLTAVYNSTSTISFIDMSSVRAANLRVGETSGGFMTIASGHIFYVHLMYEAA